MRRLHTIVTVLLAVGLVVTLVLWQTTRRELQHQVRTIADANVALRESLGELTREITKKEREIDELQTPCRPHEPISRNRL
jgi:cell division protein FtsB